MTKNQSINKKVSKISRGEEKLLPALNKSIPLDDSGLILDVQNTNLDEDTGKSKPGFKKGISGNRSGRPKGSTSVKTKVLTAFAQEIVNGNTAKFNRELNKLEGKAFIETIMGLMEYCIPKLARTESTNINLNVKEPQIIRIGDQEITIN